MLKRLFSYRGLNKIGIRGFSMTEAEFLRMWRDFSFQLTEHFDNEFNDEDLFDDIEELDELVKIVTNDGKVFIINRQVPNREIWYSSPLSGPSHFRLDTEVNKWLNKENKEFYDVFNTDMQRIKN